MNNTPSTMAGPGRAFPGLAAFSGLGLDLAGVVKRAESMRLVPVPRASGGSGACGREPVAASHGFELMTILGREIRGR